MKIVQSTDHFLQTVYRIEDQGTTIAVCYTQRDAEVAKAALEKDRAEREKENWISL